MLLDPSVIEDPYPFYRQLRELAPVSTLGDVSIPAGSTVLLFWAAANRDPSAFARPDEIDLTRRWPRRHVAFGRGIHHCVGAPLARLEAQVVLGSLLERTSAIVIDDGALPRRIDSLQVRRHEYLPVGLTP
jgi:hypothetical protein